MGYMALMMARSRAVILFSLVLPTLLLIVLGFAFPAFDGGGVIPGGTHREADIMTWLVPGIVVSNIIAISLMGNLGILVQWRQSGVIRGLSATPMPVWQIMAARGACQVFVVLLQSLLTVGIAAWLFEFRMLPSHTLPAIVIVVISATAFLALSQLLAAMISRVEIANSIGQVLYPVLCFLTGVILPLNVLPQFVGPAIAWTPSYLAVEALRGATLDGWSGIHLLAASGLVLWAVVALTVASWKSRARA